MFCIGNDLLRSFALEAYIHKLHGDPPLSSSVSCDFLSYKTAPKQQLNGELSGKHTLNHSKSRKNQSDADGEIYPRVNQLTIVQCLLKADLTAIRIQMLSKLAGVLRKALSRTGVCTALEVHNAML